MKCLDLTVMLKANGVLLISNYAILVTDGKFFCLSSRMVWKKMCQVTK